MLTSRFVEALGYAATLHAAQRRKVSGEPYVAHLLAVAALVLENGGDEDTAIAALLHDAVEDQGGQATREEIGRRFGQRVAAIVDGCTDADTTPKPPWRARKEQYLERLCTADPAVRLIAAADKLHNVRAILRAHRDLGTDLWAHFRGGREGTLWYHRRVLDTLTAVERTPLVDELAVAVARLESLD